MYFSPCVFFTLCLGLRIFHPTLEFPPVYFSPCACVFFTLCIFHPVLWTAYFSPCVFFTLCLGLSIFHPTLEFPPVYFSPCACVFFTLACVFFTLPWNFTLCIFHPAPVYFSPCVFFTMCHGLSIFHPTLEFPPWIFDPVYFSPCALD